MKKFPLFIFITLILFMPLFFINARARDGDNVNTGDPIDGVCGSWNTKTVNTIPTIDGAQYGQASTTTGLCYKGINGTVTFGNKFSNQYDWTCYGKHDGTNDSSCYAYQNVSTDKICGSADGGLFFNKPTENLCITGYKSSVVSREFNKYLWKCINRENILDKTSCSAYISSAVVNGLCGDYDGSPYTTTEPTNLCEKGVVQDFSGPSDSLYNWKCKGFNSDPVSCSVGSQTQDSFDGKCGTANGVGSKEEPTENLCSKGSLVAIAEKDGNWIWICKGIGRSSKDSPCTAPIITNTDSDSGGGGDNTSDGTGDQNNDGNGNGNGSVDKVTAYSKAGGLIPECPSDGCGFKEIIILINKVIKFLLKDIAIPLAAIVFMYAGFLLITAGGDPGKLTKAKAMLRNVLIGFVIALAAWLIIHTILSSLGVTTSLLGIGK